MITSIRDSRAASLWRQGLSAWLLILVAAPLLLTACATGDCIPRFYRGYDPELPWEPRIEAAEDKDAYQREHLYFTSMPDERLPVLLARPFGDEEVPAVIFLHGIGQRKEFLDEIAEPFVDAGFAIVTFDQHDRGERRLEPRSNIRSAFALRRRGALTVIETRRTVDYLQSREDIAGERIYLVGASYGAITGSTAAAFDERIQAVVLTYGGGHLPTLFTSEAVKDEIGILVYPLRYLASWFFWPADPIRYVDRISPRPLLMQNGVYDELIPKAAAERLYEAAEEPKEIVWYDSDHIGLDEEVVEEVLDDAIAWLLERDEEAGASAVEREDPENAM